MERFSIRSANVFIEADNELNILSDGIAKFQANVFHSNVINDMFITSSNFYKKVKKDSFDQVDGTYHTKVGVNYNLDTGGIVDINNGSASGSKVAVGALNSYAGLLTGRTQINQIDISNPSFLTQADRYVLSAEEPGATQQEIQNTINTAVKDGITPQSKFEEKTIPLKTETPSTTNSIFVSPDISLKKLNEVPENFNLSPNFTLGMLSSKSAVTKNKLVSQSNKTYGELLFNLSAVALNICEPVLKLYPNMYVTSAFRLQSSSASTSQHPLGQAVDIQFKGITKKQYYDIAKVLSSKLNYDQLLLEYASSTNNPWIHISIDPSKRNRTQIMTFNDHKKYGDGLTQLA